MKLWLSRNTYVDYGMRFVVISEKDEVLRISHAVMSELFDRRLAPRIRRSLYEPLTSDGLSANLRWISGSRGDTGTRE